MPGYEVFDPSGTLIMHVRRGTWAAMPDAEVRGCALGGAPKKLGGGTHRASDFIVRQLDRGTTADRVRLSQTTDNMPRADGSTETRETWETKRAAMAADPPEGR